MVEKATSHLAQGGPVHDLLFAGHGALQGPSWAHPSVMGCLVFAWMFPACTASLGAAAGGESSSLASFPSNIVYSEVSVQHQSH